MRRRVTKKAPKKFNYVKSEGNLVKDVNRLKKLVKKVKPEVKYIQPAGGNDLVGQVSVNATGSNGFFITNTCGSGVGNGDRVGNETKLIGINCRLQIQQMSASTQPIRCIFEIFKFTDRTSSISQMLPYIYQPDSISGVIDYNSTRNPSYINEYKRIASRKVYLRADNFSGQAINTCVKMFVKQNQKLRYSSTTSADAVNYGYALFVRADNGNRDGATASTLTNIPVTATSTGARYYYVFKTYFTDS